MHCHTCGFAVPVAAVTCTGCGSRIGGHPSQAPAYEMAGAGPLAVPAISYRTYPPLAVPDPAYGSPAVPDAAYGSPGVPDVAYGSPAVPDAAHGSPGVSRAAYGPPRESRGPGTVLHWIVPVGRSWQSMVAGYLAVFSIIIWVLGPAALGMGVWALARSRRENVRGTGRAVFAVVAGLLSTLAMVILLMRAMSMS
jgi:hypothetical protein